VGGARPAAHPNVPPEIRRRENHLYVLLVWRKGSETSLKPSDLNYRAAMVRAGRVRADRPNEPAALGQHLAPLVAICAGYFMVILDVTIINVAVPVIGRELSASLTDIQWITDGYTLVFAGLLLTGGALGDRLGNRRIFCTGVVVFTVASAACGLAPNTGLLVAARLLEGLGAALNVPGSLALLWVVCLSRLWAGAGSFSSTCPSDAPACC
jgi:hypothetical protein